MIDTEKNHPNHPTLVGKFLRERGYLDCTEITKLGKIHFKIDTKSEAGLRRLNLAEINLRPYEPKNRNHTIAFVRGVPESFAEDEMLDNSEAEYQVIQVQRIKRRDRNGGLQDTTNIKVTVEGTQVPKWLKIYGCNFRPELYIFPIRQCQNCWRFGHGAKFCTAKGKMRYLRRESSHQYRCKMSKLPKPTQRKRPRMPRKEATREDPRKNEGEANQLRSGRDPIPKAAEPLQPPRGAGRRGRSRISNTPRILASQRANGWTRAPERTGGP